MLDIKLFTIQMQRLERVFGYEIGNRIDVYWQELQKIRQLTNDTFLKVVDEIVLNETSFPKIAIFKKYVDMLEVKQTSTSSKKYGRADCPYCCGDGRVFYERHEELYNSTIITSVVCSCVEDEVKETITASGLQNIENIGLKELIDAGKYLRDKTGVYRILKEDSNEDNNKEVYPLDFEDSNIISIAHRRVYGGAK